MGKTIDYSKIKAMAASILECIGEDDEGENPSLPAQKKDINDGGQEPNIDFAGDEHEDDSEGKKKKSKDSAMALMTATLASKFGKSAPE